MLNLSSRRTWLENNVSQQPADANHCGLIAIAIILCLPSLSPSILSPDRRTLYSHRLCFCRLSGPRSPTLWLPSPQIYERLYAGLLSGDAAVSIFTQYLDRCCPANPMLLAYTCVGKRRPSRWSTAMQSAELTISAQSCCPALSSSSIHMPSACVAARQILIQFII
jgi:hypothetical protein